MTNVYEELARLRKENYQLSLENEGLRNELDNYRGIIIESAAAGAEHGAESGLADLRDAIANDSDLDGHYENWTGARLGIDEDDVDDDE